MSGRHSSSLSINDEFWNRDTSASLPWIRAYVMAQTFSPTGSNLAIRYNLPGGDGALRRARVSLGYIIPYPTYEAVVTPDLDVHVEHVEVDRGGGGDIAEIHPRATGKGKYR